MDEIICIVGSTATGKTAKALELSKERPSIIISADSRQVYKGMDIVVGKDHPKDIEIFGIDLVNPNESCSVSVWHDAVNPHIKEAIAQDKQVIVVGGTGLYVRAITDGIETMSVPINDALRLELEPLSIAKLQERLVDLDKDKFKSMNHSDSLNPRRLIRAIEIALSTPQAKSSIAKPTSHLIGLKYKDANNQKNNIRSRVISRLELGAVEETSRLLKLFGNSVQSMSAIGYKSIIKYLDGEFTKEEMIEAWVNDEMSYVKRQMTWFRKVKSIQWHEIDIAGV